MLALEFALRHPTLVSRLVLMNPAPVSQAQVAMLRQSYVAQLGSDMDRQRAIQAGAAYKEGNPDTVAARYRIHFKQALQRPADYERLMARMSAGFRDQGKDGILKAWASSVTTKMPPVRSWYRTLAAFSAPVPIRMP